METTKQSDAGYPEEAPPEVAGDDTGTGKAASAAEEAAGPEEAARRAPDTDDGNATGGNP